MKSLWDIQRDDGRSYGSLPKDAVYPWATEQIQLSERYQRGEINSSQTESGRKRKKAVLNKVQKALIQRSNLSEQEITSRMAQVKERLEDPGLLKNFEFFKIPESDFMLQFYFAVWDRRIAEVMIYTHNYGKDLKGVMQKIPKDDVWYQMSYFEGMNINERKKSQNVVDFIKSHNIKRATSFGGGDIPERLYGLPKDLKLTVFDDGPVSPLEQLFSDKERQNINYIHESLDKAVIHPELHATQQLVWMHGVSMYLDEAKKQAMTGAILAGLLLLEPEGFMKYDYLVWTDSIKRVITTQGWPYDPKNPMVIFPNPTLAIQQGRETLWRVNEKLGGQARVDVLDPELTFIEPWGVTSVRFTIQKRRS